MTDEPTLSFPSMRAAASASGIPFSLMSAWKSSGLPGFERSGRVHLRTVLAAVFSQSEHAEMAPPTGMRNWREQLNRIQAERQSLKFEQERARLVERAWVAARILSAAQELNRYRLTSEGEHPMKFAATNGDTAECRTVLRGIWDQIFTAIQSLASQLNEEENHSQTETPPSARPSGATKGGK